MNVVNKSEAIHRVSDKRGFRMILNEKGLCPYTSFSLQDWAQNADWDTPAVVRTAVHAQGRGLWYCKNFYYVQGVIDKYFANNPNYYINEFIPKVAEYRVFVVSGRVAWVAKKTPGNPDDVAWNVNQGGRFDNVRWGDWPLSVCHAAIKAFHLTGLDFSGIDVMEDADGKAYVLEANSAPSQTSPYRQQCTAKAFQWIVDHGRDMIPLGGEGKYLPIIHPALDDKAIIGG
jgi:ribosomal protein S6--L-glutamate ligase